MKTFIYRFAELLLILLILSTACYAFYQSSLPPKESAQESDKVGEIIGEIIPPQTPPGQYLQKNLRKLAHFTEFFFLGLWSSLFVFIYLKKKWAYISLVPFGFFIAFIDETVQIFSKRGPSVQDMWIDIFGYSSAVAVVLLSLCILLFVRFILDRIYA